MANWEDDKKHTEDAKGIRKRKMKKGMFFINENLGHDYSSSGPLNVVK